MSLRHAIVRQARHATLVAIVLSTSATAAGKAASSQDHATPGNHTYSLRFGGRERAYILHVPRAASDGRALPVVLAFHGGGGEAAGFQGYAGLDAVADREGFLVVYPYGSGVLPRRLLTWNAGECCGYAMNQRIDDVGFAIAVLDDVAKHAAVDPRRVYATGHSNGAMMAYRLGGERADRIAAIVPVSGSYDLEHFAPSRPVAVLDLHSVDDPRALYNGGIGPPFPGTNVRSSHRSVTESLDRWVRNNGCKGPPDTVETRVGRAGTPDAGQTATHLRWKSCAAGGAVEHWKLTKVGHGWPGSTSPQLREALIGPPTTLVNAAEEIWKFVATIRR